MRLYFLPVWRGNGDVLMGKAGEGLRRGLARKYQKIGNEAAITPQGAGTYDVTTSAAVPLPSVDELIVKGEFKRPSDGSRDGRSDGETSGSTDLRINRRVLVIPALDYKLRPFPFDPKIGDQVTVGGSNYSIRRIDPEIFDDVTVRMELLLDQA